MFIFYFSIVIDSDKRTSLRAFKKKNTITMKLEPVTCISMFGYAMNFALPEMAKSEVLDFSGPTCLS